jgi:hypothetical protein
MRFSCGDRKMQWITSELSCLKNKETKATKRSRAREKQCLEDKTIDDDECKHLRGEFLSLREEYQLMHGRAYDDYHVGIEEAIKSDLRAIFGYVGLKQERVGYPSVMHFKGRLAYLPDDIYDIFADFIQRTYADDVWVTSDPGPDLMQDDPPFGAFQFSTGTECFAGAGYQQDAGHDGLPPLLLKSCASAFARPVFLLIRFIRYALRRLGWTDLPAYGHR